MQIIHWAVAATALFTPVLSAPTSQPNYWWNVTQWDGACTPKACHYSFHVAAPMDGMYPGFEANCTGKDTGLFKQCTVIDWETTTGIPDVSAKLKHQPDPAHPNGVALMGLSLAWVDGHDGYLTSYNYTDKHTALFNSGGSAGKKFRVFPTAASATG